MDPPDAPFDRLAARWRLYEELGLDDVWVPDHTSNYGDRSAPLFDCWTALAALASAPTRVGVGTLVSNMVLRPPAMLARAAIAVDHLSRGRLEPGVGTGVAPFDDETVVEAYWPRRQRVARFGEYVDVVAPVLHATHPVTYGGSFYSTLTEPRPAALSAGSIPLTVGGAAPAVVRVAAKHAACWNTHGPFHETDRERIISSSVASNAALTAECLAIGRDPSALRRSFLLVGPTDPLDDPVRAFDDN